MELFLIIFTGVVGAVVTEVVSFDFKQSAVRGSALPSLVVGLVFYLFPNMLSEHLMATVPVVFIGASFAGMTSPKVVPNLGWIAVSGVIFGLIFLNASNFFQDFGGGLGTIAAVSVLVVIGLMNGLSVLRKKLL
ncbi:MAG: hypothetical protein ABH856_02765 [Patescibacteria group bacterium]|nr:hypothetical protein [Patescibacteria group bacterium]